MISTLGLRRAFAHPYAAQMAGVLASLIHIAWTASVLILSGGVSCITTWRDLLTKAWDSFDPLHAPMESCPVAGPTGCAKGERVMERDQGRRGSFVEL